MTRKRYIVVDMLRLVVHAANGQDRDGAPLVLASIMQRWPKLRYVFANGAYASLKARVAL